MNFTKTDFALFRHDLNEALKPLAKKHDLNFTIGAFRYDDLSFSFKMDAAKKTNNGNPVDIAKEEFVRYCPLYNLKPEHYRARCHVMGDPRTVFLIAGLNLKARKNCIIIEREFDGSQYKCPRSSLVFDIEPNGD